MAIGPEIPNIGLMGSWDAAAPAGAADWGIPLVFTFPFPEN